LDTIETHSKFNSSLQNFITSPKNFGYLNDYYHYYFKIEKRRNEMNEKIEREKKEMNTRTVHHQRNLISLIHNLLISEVLF
jgi:hypothetical protein